MSFSRRRKSVSTRDQLGSMGLALLEKVGTRVLDGHESVGYVDFLMSLLCLYTVKSVHFHLLLSLTSAAAGICSQKSFRLRARFHFRKCIWRICDNLMLLGSSRGCLSCQGVYVRTTTWPNVRSISFHDRRLLRGSGRGRDTGILKRSHVADQSEQVSPMKPISLSTGSKPALPA